MWRTAKGLVGVGLLLCALAVQVSLILLVEFLDWIEPE